MGKALVEKTESVWVRVDRRDWHGIKDAQIADVPDGVWARCEIPVSTTTGLTLVAVCRVWVTPKDAQTIRAAHMEFVPSDADRAMVMGLHTPLRDPNAKALYREMKAGFTGNAAAQKDAMKAALDEAVKRGLVTPADATAIRTEHDLPSSISGG